MSGTVDQKQDGAPASKPNNDSSNNHNSSADSLKSREPKLVHYDMQSAFYHNMYGSMPTSTGAPADYAGPAPALMYSFQYNNNQGLGEGAHGTLWNTTAAPQGNPAVQDAMFSMGYHHGSNDYYYHPYNYSFYPSMEYNDMTATNTWGFPASTTAAAKQLAHHPTYYHQNTGHLSAAATGGLSQNQLSHRGGHGSQQLIGVQQHQLPNLVQSQSAQQPQSGVKDSEDSLSLGSNFSKLSVNNQEDLSSVNNHQINNQTSQQQSNISSGSNKSWANIAGQQPKGSAATSLPISNYNKRPGASNMGFGTVTSGTPSTNASNHVQSNSMETVKHPPGRGTPATAGIIASNSSHKPGAAQGDPMFVGASTGHIRGSAPVFDRRFNQMGGRGNNSWQNPQHQPWNSSPSLNNVMPQGGMTPMDTTIKTGDPKTDARLHELEKSINPPELDLDFDKARFFVLKSYSEDDIHRSIKYGIWCSTENGNRRLDNAYQEMQACGGQVFLYFSVNGSGHFCGVAKMISGVDYDKQAGVWCQAKWRGKFDLKWLYVKDVPNSHLRHIRLETNENKPVTNSRDATEVMPLEKGKQVLKVIHTFKHSTSIFDDFMHYEKREKEVNASNARQSQRN